VEELLLIVPDDVDLLELIAGELVEGGKAVPDDGVAGYLEERLGDVEGEWSEACASGWTTNLVGQLR